MLQQKFHFLFKNKLFTIFCGYKKLLPLLFCCCCWIQDLRSGIRDPGSEIRDSWSGDPGSEIRDPRSGNRDPRSGIWDPGSEIRDPRSGICDTGSEIRITLLVKRSWDTKCFQKILHYFIEKLLSPNECEKRVRKGISGHFFAELTQEHYAHFT